MGLVKNLRWMFEQRQKAIRDRWAEDDYIREESEAIGEARGRAQGETIGEARGRGIGKIEGVVAAVETAMCNTDWDLQTACHNLGITVEEYRKVKQSLK